VSEVDAPQRTQRRSRLITLPDYYRRLEAIISPDYARNGVRRAIALGLYVGPPGLRNETFNSTIQTRNLLTQTERSLAYSRSPANSDSRGSGCISWFVARLQHPRMPSSLAKNKFWPNPEGYRHTLPIEIRGVEPAIVNCARPRHFIQMARRD